MPLVHAVLADAALDKIHKIPTSFWMKVGAVVLAIVLIVIIIRKVMETSKIVLGAVAFIIVGLMFFNWVYYRTEPKFMTPFVNRIAPFFPSAGAYDVKQQSTPDKEHDKSKK